MVTRSTLDSFLATCKHFIPAPLFRVAARLYHPLLSWTGALWYRFPSRSLRVIGVTGTKGKSTVVYLSTKIFQHAGYTVASLGSLGTTIGAQHWPNTVKMTMPGRWKVQRFLRAAVRAGCTHVILEVPSEGLAQGRHLGVTFDCAVLTNLHPEHLEAHGSFERYRAAKALLFQATTTHHILNADDEASEYFSQFPAQKKLWYGIHGGEMRATDIDVHEDRVAFSVYGTRFSMHLGGVFNISNALAALSIGALYGIDLPTAMPALTQIEEVPGRMQWLSRHPFGVVVDYAHTPDSLRAVYEALRPHAKRLVVVLGAAGGGRDRWKRPLFGEIAASFGDRIILTDEDPYDEDPQSIIDQVYRGIPDGDRSKVKIVLDRRAAIADALDAAQPGDIVVITGKGSETSIARAHALHVPWSDAQVVRELLLRK